MFTSVSHISLAAVLVVCLLSAVHSSLCHKVSPIRFFLQCVTCPVHPYVIDAPIFVILRKDITLLVYLFRSLTISRLRFSLCLCFQNVIPFSQLRKGHRYCYNRSTTHHN
jgi:hypothetical protein